MPPSPVTSVSLIQMKLFGRFVNFIRNKITVMKGIAYVTDEKGKK